ncbi:unnamed protein product [Protopolystoma xenopodis]|uniref:Uncharacterized protein n=1 Tax=Protopolystoma xenopodis TaxID=117903 RepID=A0A3S5BRC6_9PLAT|nr:unnamed protein product [Protopolystoma xenopodis]
MKKRCPGLRQPETAITTLYAGLRQSSQGPTEIQHHDTLAFEVSCPIFLAGIGVYGYASLMDSLDSAITRAPSVRSTLPGIRMTVCIRIKRWTWRKGPVNWISGDPIQDSQVQRLVTNPELIRSNICYNSRRRRRLLEPQQHTLLSYGSRHLQERLPQFTGFLTVSHQHASNRVLNRGTSRATVSGQLGTTFNPELLTLMNNALLSETVSSQLPEGIRHSVNGTGHYLRSYDPGSLIQVSC